MSLNSEINSAANEAQSVLAETGGAEPGATNALYNGANYLAVYGQPIVQRIMQVGGGYTNRVFLPLTATKAQFSTAPLPEKTWTRTDLTPPVTYRIQSVDPADANLYSLTLSKGG